MSEHYENALELLRAEYLEQPGVRLTPADAAELLELDERTALTILRALEGSGFLELTSGGQFRLAELTERWSPSR